MSKIATEDKIKMRIDSGDHKPGALAAPGGFVSIAAQ